MERKQFIKSCAFACLAGSTLAAALEGCTVSNKIITGIISGSNMVVPLSAFTIPGNKFKRYIVVRHEQLEFPICVYRFGENDYSALWMKCTHQGAELQVFGDMLQCPAHGSEFNNRGVVENPPADKNLRTFPVTISNNEIKLYLG